MRFRYIGTEEMIYQGPPARVLGYGDIVRALTNPNPDTSNHSKRTRNWTDKNSRHPCPRLTNPRSWPPQRVKQEQPVQICAAFRPGHGGRFRRSKDPLKYSQAHPHRSNAL